METLRIRNTEENKNHLDSINRFYVVNGGTINVHMDAEERAKVTSIRGFKKALGL
jgi:hypothetical protein